MIPTSKFEDKAYMISELCLPFKTDELAQLLEHETNLQKRSAEDQDFDYKYMMHLKLLYMRSIPAMQKGTYRKIPFKELNKQILASVNSGIKEYPLMPREGVGFDAPEKTSLPPRRTREEMLQFINTVRNKQK